MSDEHLKTALTAWRLLYEDDAYRLDHLEDYHKTLVERADELRTSGLVTLEAWQMLKTAADAAYEQTETSLREHRRDCIKDNVMPLPQGD